MHEFKPPVNAGYLPTYDHCFVCGQSHSRGLRIRYFTDGEGRVHAYFKPEDTLTGYDDIVHGGVISSLLDELLGWPIALQTGCFSMTVELNVNFLRPVHANQTYIATAYPGTGNGAFRTGTGEIREESGRLCAKAKGKFYLLSKDSTKDFAKKMNYQPGDLPVFKEENSK
jgi:uncharacterized protein (TIGR00369 family)